MRRQVANPQLVPLSLRDRAASIRWAAKRVRVEKLADELREFADQLEAEAGDEPRDDEVADV